MPPDIKTFDFRPAPRRTETGDADDGPLQFKINVRDEDDEIASEEIFTVVDYAPLNAFSALGVAMAQGTIASTVNADRFLRTMLIPEDQQRWGLLVADPKLRIDAREIGPLVSWLVEVLSDRPTVRPSGLPNGPASNGLSSTDAAPSPEPTPET